MRKELARLDKAHSRLLELIAPLDAEKFAQRAAVNEWSVAEVVHHLCLVEQRVIDGLVRQLSEPPQSAGFVSRLIPYWLLVGRRVRRVRSPKAVEPLDAPPKETAIENYNRVRAGLKALAAEHGRERLQRVVMKHPFLGKLSGTKAIAFVGYHEQRHCKQISEIIRKLY